ncbi:hypothetical protein AUJ38_01745 [bacterium CG1_02_42_9]|nr:MAG: hypothetical protein AUJ38_01745 [bacterium CG1_02_42_9]
MLKLEITSRYDRNLRALIKENSLQKGKVHKALKFFLHNPKHPSLNLEKLRGSNVWTIRVDRAQRIFFSWIDSKTALLLDIGKHDKYQQY